MAGAARAPPGGCSAPARRKPEGAPPGGACAAAAATVGGRCLPPPPPLTGAMVLESLARIVKVQLPAYLKRLPLPESVGGFLRLTGRRPRGLP